MGRRDDMYWYGGDIVAIAVMVIFGAIVVGALIGHNWWRVERWLNVLFP